MPRPEEFVSQLPKRRMIKPDEIAESVYWLCTFPAARYVWVATARERDAGRGRGGAGEVEREKKECSRGFAKERSLVGGGRAGGGLLDCHKRNGGREGEV